VIYSITPTKINCGYIEFSVALLLLIFGNELQEGSFT
jgi:hypothetical protein